MRGSNPTTKLSRRFLGGALSAVFVGALSFGGTAALAQGIEIEEIIGLDSSEAIEVSAKTGIGIEALLEQIIEKIPPPVGAGKSACRDSADSRVSLNHHRQLIHRRSQGPAGFFRWYR